MALSIATLTAEVLTIATPPHPASIALAKTRWAAAFRAYFAQGVAPLWSTIALDAGAVAFVDNWDPFDQTGMEDAIEAMALAMAVAQSIPPIPAVNYWTVTPPLVPFVMPALPATNNALAAALVMATAVDTWARLGAAFFTVPPAGAVVPWS